MRRAPLVVLLLLAPALAGCASEGATEDVVVPYPRLGDVVTYEVDGALVEFARWENGHPFFAGPAQVRFTLAASDPVLDGARAVHDAFEVVTDVAEAGIFMRHSQRFVSPQHQAVVQAYYPLSQDQGVVAFDERGFPWLFGASALFGAELSREPRFPFALPDNLGRGRVMDLAWVVVGQEDVEGVAATRLDLEGNASVSGSVWMERGSAWPLKARLAIHDAGLAPNVRADAAYPVEMTARRVAHEAGSESLPPRNRGAAFAQDAAVERLSWNDEHPPDGDPGYIGYPLADAIRDAKLLDQGLNEWLAQADDPRVYRGSYGDAPGPLEGTRAPHWLIQYVDRNERYYEVEVERVRAAALLGDGVPRVNRSGPAAPPVDPLHGWFAAQDVPDQFVPLSEGVRVMKEVFEAPDVQIFLRSLKSPAGYSYYIDGGFEREGGRYTVVYAPNTGFIEHATGPVSPRFARA